MTHTNVTPQGLDVLLRAPHLPTRHEVDCVQTRVQMQTPETPQIVLYAANTAECDRIQTPEQLQTSETPETPQIGPYVAYSAKSDNLTMSRGVPS